MTPVQVGQDVLSVARFEVLRAIRTWRALAFAVVLIIANVGSTWLFIQGIGQMEQQLARSLGVATTSRPGAMMEQLRQGESFREMVEALTGSSSPAVMDQPILAVFQLWIGMIFLPFFGAATASEAIAADVQTGAIRFEALRTGRAELVLGRSLGQLAIIASALVLTLVSVWGLGQVSMVGQSPGELATALVWWGGQACLFALPFLGVGIACSQWTTSPVWARILALCVTAGTWIAYGWVSWVSSSPWVYLADILAPLLPQTWMGGLWQSGGSWAASALALAGLGLAAVGLGFVRFARRDL